MHRILDLLVLLRLGTDVLHLLSARRRHQVYSAGGLGRAGGERRRSRLIHELRRHHAASLRGRSPRQLPAPRLSAGGVLHQVVRLLQALDAEGLSLDASARPCLLDCSARSAGLPDCTGLHEQGLVRFVWHGCCSE